MAEEILFTQEGYDKIVEEHEYLVSVRRLEVTEQLKTARSFGDLSENAEYDAAKNEQAMVEGEILEIEEKLKYAVIIKDAAKKGTVSLGSKVDFLDVDLNEELTYEIVGTTEADVELGKISNESPIGNALLGHKVNDEVKVAVPTGMATLKIKKVY